MAIILNINNQISRKNTTKNSFNIIRYIRLYLNEFIKFLSKRL